MTDQAASTTQTNQQSSSQQNQSSSSAQADGASSHTQTPTRPDYLPDTAWDATANAPRADVIKSAFETHAAHAARMAARPEKADGYELKFTDGFKPETPLEFKPDDPRVAPLREFAHKNNWTQAEFSEALQIEAGSIIAENKAYQTAVAAETAKLGAKATERVTALKTWLTGHLGAEAANDLLGTDNTGGLLIYSAAAVGYLEKLQLAMTNQGTAPYQNGGREPPAPPPTTMEDRWYGKGKAS